MTVTLPKDANIQPHWITGTTIERAIIPMSSVSVPGVSYDVELDYETRQLKCECKGFFYKGRCRHVAALKFASYKKKAKKKGVADTTVESFYKFTPEDLGDRQRQVFLTLRDEGPLSNKQLSSRMNWPINTITPSVKELRDMGLVEEDGTQFDTKTNRREMIWSVI